MEGRSYEGDTNLRYRFGFNTQEKDDEVYGEGNANTAEFWEYDARLGRRWNIDPIVKHWLSVYCTFSNNPIIKVDINGDDDFFDKNGKLIYSSNTGHSIKIIDTKDLTMNQIKFMLSAMYVTKPEIKEEESIDKLKHQFLTSISQDLKGYDLFYDRNNSRMAKEITKHYYDKLQFQENNNTVAAEQAIGDPAVYNHAIMHTDNEKVGDKIHLSIEGGTGFLNSKHMNDYWNMMNTLVHEQEHRMRRSSGDFDKPASHLNAYWKQVTHSSFKNTTDDFQIDQIKVIGGFLGSVNDKNLTKKFEKQLGIKFTKIEYVEAQGAEMYGHWNVEYNKTSEK